MRAGFTEVDITPPVGTQKIGWLKKVESGCVIDPICARIAVFESRDKRIAVIQLDTLSLGWNQVNDMRQRIESTHGFPGTNIMVTTTHNHAGPAVANCGDVPRDESYTETMIGNVVEGFGQVLENLTEAEIGFGRAFEWDVSFNRRVLLRDGTTRTHGSFATPDALCFEGPIDPEVAVLAVRSPAGELLGALVNFACHPTHHGPTPELSAGYPGVLAAECRKRGCPVTLFLNGACGNISFSDPTGRIERLTKEQVGEKLAADAFAAMQQMTFAADVSLSAGIRTLRLPFREVTEDEVKGTVRGAQRFVDPAVYDRAMPELLEKISKRGKQLAEVQALGLNDVAIVSVPAEYFVEHGLRIKEQTWPRSTMVSSCSNGMVGYVPTREAFRRGGYETTFGFGYKLAPEAGDMLADAAIELINGTVAAT